MNFNNQVVWITGASSGIGRALAIEFSKLNTRLILSARNTEQLNETKSLCTNTDNIKVLILDLAEYNLAQQKVYEAIGLFGTVDILINNGGISQRSLVKETPIEVDKKVFDVNYFGTVALTKALLPHLIEKKDGQIAVTSSVVGKFGSPLRSSYSASKHAIHGFFDSLRAELYNDNIAVTIVCPGYVHTNVSLNALNAAGEKTNVMDNATKNGITPELMAQKYIKAIYKKKNEIWVGKKEKLAVYIKRFFPSLLAKMVRKANVT
jgi:dehydrogenase/reductase SDR family protein 7B